VGDRFPSVLPSGAVVGWRWVYLSVFSGVSLDCVDPPLESRHRC
jgi:hypothetical protein